MAQGCSTGLKQEIQITEEIDKQIQTFSASLGACYMCAAFNQVVLSDLSREFIKKQINEFINTIHKDSLLINKLKTNRYNENEILSQINKIKHYLKNHTKPIGSMKEEIETIHSFYKEKFKWSNIFNKFSLSMSCSRSDINCEQFQKRYIYKLLFLRICTRYLLKIQLDPLEQSNIFLIISVLLNESERLINFKGGFHSLVFLKIMFILFDEITEQHIKTFNIYFNKKFIKKTSTFELIMSLGIVTTKYIKNQENIEEQMKKMLSNKTFIGEIYDDYWNTKSEQNSREMIAIKNQIESNVYNSIYDLSVDDIFKDQLNHLDEIVVNYIIDTSKELFNKDSKIIDHPFIDEKYNDKLFETFNIQNLISSFGIIYSKEDFKKLVQYCYHQLQEKIPLDNLHNLLKTYYNEQLQKEQEKHLTEIERIIENRKPEIIILTIHDRLLLQSLGPISQHKSRQSASQKGGTKPISESEINITILNKYHTELFNRLKTLTLLKDYKMDSTGIAYSPKKLNENVLKGKFLGTGHATVGIMCNEKPIVIDSNLPDKPFEQVMWNKGSIYKYRTYDAENNQYRRSEDRLLKLNDIEPILYEKLEPIAGGEELIEEYYKQGYQTFKVDRWGDAGKIDPTSLQVRSYNYIVFYRNPNTMGGKRKNKRK